MQVGSGDTWTQVGPFSVTSFPPFSPSPSQGGSCELGNRMRQVSLPGRLLPRLQAEGLDRQDHQGLLRSAFVIIQMTNQPLWSDQSRVKSSVNGILYCDKWTGVVGNH